MINLHRIKRPYYYKGVFMYHFIVNPGARSGTGIKVWKKLESILVERNLSYRVSFSKSPHHTTRLLRSITADQKEHCFVILGGDGSINEAINGILYPDKVTLGYIPLGSGNDFGRGLHISSDAKKALESILDSSHKDKLNIGVLTYGDRKRRFGVSSGFGYDASICHVLSVSPLKKILNFFKLGKLSYVALSLDRLWHTTPAPMDIELDHDRQLHFEKTYFAAAMNLPYEGGGCMFCPKARHDDDKLDLIVIADVPKLQALLILPTVFFGLHTKLKGVHLYQFQKAKLRSEIPLPLHTDGEPVFLQKEIAFELEASSLQILRE